MLLLLITYYKTTGCKYILFTHLHVKRVLCTYCMLKVNKFLLKIYAFDALMFQKSVPTWITDGISGKFKAKKADGLAKGKEKLAKLLYR